MIDLAFEQKYIEQGVTERTLIVAYRSFAMRAWLFGVASVVFMLLGLFFASAITTREVLIGNSMFFLALWVHSTGNAYVRRHRTLYRAPALLPKNWLPNPFLPAAQLGAVSITTAGDVQDVQVLPPSHRITEHRGIDPSRHRKHNRR